MALLKRLVLITDKRPNIKQLHMQGIDIRVLGLLKASSKQNKLINKVCFPTLKFQAVQCCIEIKFVSLIWKPVSNLTRIYKIYENNLSLTKVRDIIRFVYFPKVKSYNSICFAFFKTQNCKFIFINWFFLSNIKQLLKIQEKFIHWNFI